jgi:predicted acylesterase/phospholipase RssA
LTCRHAFCTDCIRDLTSDTSPHRVPQIRCPFHRSLEQFSPRLLPVLSGYRILSLDGGGVTCLAQLIILRCIEEKCFGIPIAQLFDLFIGTSIGGQIALALTTPAPLAPLTVDAAIAKVKQLMTKGFVRPKWFKSIWSKSTYMTSELESQLQILFGQETRLYSVAKTSPPRNAPNVAVTTVVQESKQLHLVTN